MNAKRIVKPAVLAASTLVLMASAGWASTDEQRCLSGRAKAKAKYEQCVNNWLASYYGGLIYDYDRGQEKLAKCRTTYDRAWWAKLWGLPFSQCDVAFRYMDNGDETVTDHLTGLQWEKKNDNGLSIHYALDTYEWTDLTDSNYTNADGHAFTTFLAALNTPPCFAGHCDWRLPTVSELQTILRAEPYPCSTSPCIDSTFGPTMSTYPYWSATSVVGDPDLWGVDQHRAWMVWFSSGGLTYMEKATFYFARAVRGGL